MAPRQYFFRATDGSRIGPVSLNAVAEMIQGGKVKANTPISIDGENFKPMKSLPEMATLLSVDVDLPDASEGDDIFETPATYSGDITQVSIPKLMYHFTAAKANGRLLLTNQAVRKEVFLVNGKPVAVRSGLERDRLSSHLVRAGVLDGAKMKAVLAQLEGNEDRLADYLVQRRLIQPHQLFEQLRQRLLETIYEVFAWRVGTYAFYDGQEYNGSLLPLNLNPWEVIAQGVRSGYDLEELRALLEPLRNRILLPRNNDHVHVSKLQLHPSELKVFKSVTAGRTLGGILDRLGGDDRSDQMVLTMVYMGIELELIGIGEEIVADPIDGAGGEAGDEWDAMLGEAFTAESESAAEPAAAGGGAAAAATDAIQPTPALSRQEQTLLEVLNELKEQNHFERLGLERDATTAQASKAFMQVGRQYHPDNVPQDASEQHRELASSIFALLNDAHQTLSNDAKREEYAAALDAGFEDGEVDVSNIMESESLFQKAEILIGNRKYREAKDLLQQAIELNPDEGEFYIYLGFATYFADPSPSSMMRTQCFNQIKRGLKMRDDNVSNGYLFLGRIHKASGEPEKASKAFKKALSIDRNNLEASRELRVLSMRSGKKKGLFRKK